VRQAALISQTLRAHHCKSYLMTSDVEAVVLTSDPQTFDSLHDDGSTTIINVSPLPELLPTTTLTRGRWFRSILSWARSGSNFGRWLERTVKRLVWRLRYLDRFTLLLRPLRRTPVAVVDEASLRGSAMYQELMALHSKEPFIRVVVFDLFDLPVAMAFATDHNTEVIVR